MRQVLTPTRVHLASLVLGAVALLVIGRDQWFAYDDWALLHPSLDWWASHQGHWTTAPTLLFQLLRVTVGLHSYLPYLALAVVAHLAVVHLIWRLGMRAGATPWLATGFAAVTVLLGCAAEDLFWAFQVGFMGAVAVALVVVLLVDRAELTLPWAIAAGVIAVLALPFSGTALPVLAAAAILSWIRRGFLRSVAIFAPAGVVYLVWYLLEARGATSTLGVHGIGFLTQAPVFFAVMFAAGYGQFVGVLVLGPVVALALLVWLWAARRRWSGREAVAYALLLASAIFAVLTALSRGGGELTAAGSQRYVYLIVMLAVPTMALALGWIATRGLAGRVAIAAALLLVAAVNITLGVTRADAQAVTEQRVQREFSAAVALVRNDSPLATSDALPIRDIAPDLTIADVEADLRQGLVAPVPFARADTAAVKASLAPR
ncbi:MAG: hypothetical protein ABIO06_06920 [Pseudolysinimonas sp.]